MKNNKKYLSLAILFFICCRAATVSGQERLYSNTFPLEDVKLLDGIFKDACDLNVKTLLQYDTDRLLAPFLKEAGLPTKAKSFSNWIDLDGHIGGHYLSALAIHYAATGNQECKMRMEYMISELKRCQDAHKDGYVGAIPGNKTLWDQLKAGKIETNGNFSLNGKWVPWYNLHKTYAGLRDAWNYAGNEEAKQMFLDLADWGIKIISGLNNDQIEKMLNVEFGGMNEVYADAYQMTGDRKYLDVAKRFSHKLLFDKMAVGEDNLDNMHANTQVPKAIGYQRVAEFSHEKEYIEASEFFWETVVKNRSLSLGGNSRREHFPSKDKCREYVEEREGPESCNTNNMMKLTEGLFRMHPQAGYADYYERAMYNHILSSVHPEHGGYVYFTSARPRHYRVYSAPNKAMWCCVGTGMENHGKYGEFIYSHTSDSLFVNLFVASELNWREKDVLVKQETKFPYEEGSKLTVSTKKTTQFSLLIRYPEWVENGKLEITINGKPYFHSEEASSYVRISRIWKSGDVVYVKTPMRITIEEMPNVPEYISIFKGPILLGARTGTEDMKGLIADEGRWAHIAEGELLSITEAPFFVGDRQDLLFRLNNLKPRGDNPFLYDITELLQNQDRELIIEPFFSIHDSRYMMYWLSMTKQEYEISKEEMAEIERLRILLDNRTIDEVKPGEQQPEVDHAFEASKSETGYHRGEGWRDAQSGGYFSYNLLTDGKDNLSLMVRYWGADAGNRAFKILIDDQLLTTENISNKWNKEEFINVEYKIPQSFLKGKKSIIVRFEPVVGNRAGGVFRVRLLTPQ